MAGKKITDKRLAEKELLTIISVVEHLQALSPIVNLAKRVVRRIHNYHFCVFIKRAT